jgi:hypothetical protein
MENFTKSYIENNSLVVENPVLWSHAFPNDDHGHRSVRQNRRPGGTHTGIVARPFWFRF